MIAATLSDRVLHLQIHIPRPRRIVWYRDRDRPHRKCVLAPWAARATSAPTRTTPSRTAILTGPLPEPLERPLCLLRGRVGRDRRGASGTQPRYSRASRCSLSAAPPSRRQARRQGPEHPRRHPDLRQGEPGSTAGGSPSVSRPAGRPLRLDRGRFTSRGPRPSRDDSRAIDDNAFIESCRAGPSAGSPPDPCDDPGRERCAPAYHTGDLVKSTKDGFRILGASATSISARRIARVRPPTSMGAP